MLWDLILVIVGVSWVFPFSIKEALLSLHDSIVGKRRKKVWMAAPLCLFWRIWCERNRIVFNDEALSVHRMKSSFLCNLWSWSYMYIEDKPNSLLDFLTWLRCK